MRLWMWSLVAVAAVVLHRRKRGEKHPRNACDASAVPMMTWRDLLRALRSLERGRPLTPHMWSSIVNTISVTAHRESKQPGCIAATRRFVAVCERTGEAPVRESFLLADVLARDGHYVQAELTVRAVLARPARPVNNIRIDSVPLEGKEAQSFCDACNLEHLASFVYHQGRYQEALDLLDQAHAMKATIQVDPSTSAFLQRGVNEGRAWCMFRLNRWPEARQAALAALVAPEEMLWKEDSLRLLFKSALRNNDVSGAEQYLGELETLYGGSGKYARPRLLREQAKLLRLQNHHRKATRLERQAMRMMQRINAHDTHEVREFKRW